MGIKRSELDSLSDKIDGAYCMIRELRAANDAWIREVGKPRERIQKLEIAAKNHR